MIFQGMMDEGNMMEEEDDHDGSTSSSEDEIVSMCCKNLKDGQDVIAQIVPILGMYSDHFFWKLPYRIEGDSGKICSWTLPDGVFCCRPLKFRDFAVTHCVRVSQFLSFFWDIWG
jgi:hypothetical protein